MDWLDLFIALFLVAAVVRGAEVGFVRQFFSTVGFFGGLSLGALVNSLAMHDAFSTETQALLTLFVVLSFALCFMAIGEYLGIATKSRLKQLTKTNRADKVFGAALAVVTLLVAVWLSAAIFRNVESGGWQRQIRNSRIVMLLDDNLPSAPQLLTQFGRLIDPNGFPQVFSGLEPELKTDAPLPDLGNLTPAIQKVRPSVVKVEGESCDQAVEGSGFVAGDGAIVTNAHVVAGVRQPFVLDQKGKHGAKVVLFDPSLDIAILRARNLAGQPLTIDSTIAKDGTAAAVLGYPSNAGFTAGPAVVLETFEAIGRDIYNKGQTSRTIYSVKADVEHGNSGGPMINDNGDVIGVVFAKSINYDGIGYALTMKKVVNDINQAAGLTKSVSTRGCTE